MIQRHDTIEVDKLCVNGETIEVGGYNVSTNKLGFVEIDLVIYDTVTPANIGSGKFVVYFHRYGGNAIVDRQTALNALTTPGNLSGASVDTSASGIRISSNFTGVAGRTIRVIASFKLTTIIDG